ncbi:Fic family protein [Vogesella indigofera]|uniref:Fic family protein n=1 Tax=Vogesella indigofera TaxID=45465 RepID=UPI00234F178D|nr:Fic family protein [Vogesella indigofera]MDC7698337.1 Fic family protein [Vogesella indigofera]
MQSSHRWIWQHSYWPQFTWDQAALTEPLARARLAQGKVLGAARLLDNTLTLEAVASILVEDGVTTSAIEGERLDVEAVRSSVARHLGLPSAGLPTPPRAVDGLIEVLLDATRNHAQPLTQARLFGWQAALFPTGYSGLHAIRTGQLRGEEPMQVVSGRIGYEKVHFEAPGHDVLGHELASFLSWFNEPDNKMEGLIRAGLAHLWFVTVHPFEDGNGRLARAITDMALSQDEQLPMRLFSLSAQILRERETYYEILEQTQRGDVEVTTWLIWFLEQVQASATAAEQTVANTLAKARFWLRHQSASLNERQRKVLNRLLDAGPGGFEGGVNTRKYMSLAKTSRATAYRELTELVELGCLVPTGKGGRSSGYEIVC